MEIHSFNQNKQNFPVFETYKITFIFINIFTYKYVCSALEERTQDILVHIYHIKTYSFKIKLIKRQNLSNLNLSSYYKTYQHKTYQTTKLHKTYRIFFSKVVHIRLNIAM